MLATNQQIQETAELIQWLDAQLAASDCVVHLVTLINRATGHEVSLNVVTTTDRFADVMREVSHLKVMRQLQGYEVFEILDAPLPF